VINAPGGADPRRLRSVAAALLVAAAFLRASSGAFAGEDSVEDGAAPPAPPAEAGPSPEPDAGSSAPSVPEETITVRAPTDVLRADPTAFGTVVRKEQWADRITTIPDLLREVVGVQVKSLGDSFSTVSIRGSTAEQVMVYLDGVPLNRGAGGAVNLADIPLAQVERIEVYRGMTPSSLPEASIGGAILIHTRAPKGRFAADGYAGLGSHGSGEFSAGFGGEKGRGGWRIATDGGTSDGDFPFWDNNGTPDDPADDGVAPRVNNDFTSGHVLARGHLRAAETLFTFEADAFRREQGIPGVDSVQSEGARLETARLLLAARAERAGLLSGRLVLHGGLTRHDETEEFNGQGTHFVFGANTDNRYISTSLSGGGTLVAGSRQAIAFLASLRDETADLRDRSPGEGQVGFAERRILAATLEDQIVLAAGRVQIVPSLRFESSASDYAPGEAGGGVSGSGDVDSDEVTGRIGARWDLSAAWSIRGNAGNYHRLPDITELYGHRGGVVGNPGLLPERGTNADLGLTWQAVQPIGWFRTMRVEGVLFGTDAEDLIVYEPTPSGAVVAKNLSTARIRGVELSLQANLGARLTGNLNAVRQEAIETGDSFREGFPLPGRSEVEASAALGYAIGKARFAWNFTYVGPNNRSSVGSFSGELDARYLHDVSCRVLLPHRLEAIFEVHNLFDDHSVDLYRYPLPGRRYEARLAWAF